MSMESFVHELTAKKVLSIDDIIILKKYIANKHKNYSAAQNSEILTAAVHQILDKNIPSIKHPHRLALKQSLLKNTVLNNNSPISLVDVLNACISIEDKSSDFLDNMTDWVNFHVENKVSKIELEKYDIRINTPYDNDPIKTINGFEAFPTAAASIATANDDDSKSFAINHYESAKPVNYSELSLKNIINKKILKYAVCFLFVFALAFINQYGMEHPFIFEKGTVSKINPMITQINPDNTKATSFPDNFKYKAINRNQLKKFLVKKNSLLAEAEYFNTIIFVSKTYNINPLVLFAIAGQEQGFVSRQIPYSNKIVNNPFDVYHSWKSYNTNLEDACKIACTTIINLCKDRPLGFDPFSWIGKTYAEDPNWSKGVNLIYKTLELIDSDSKNNSFILQDND